MYEYNIWFHCFSRELLSADEIDYVTKAEVRDVQWFLCEDQSYGDSVVYDPSNNLHDYTDFRAVVGPDNKLTPTFALCANRTDFLCTYVGLVPTEVCFLI